ncbi:MAG: N-acetyltransferase [Pseudomonadota bacterium]
MIRNVEDADFEAVDALLRAAFGGADEANLIRRLRADGDMWFEWQTPWHGEMAGYLAVSRMRAPQGWGCLAPVAVRPEWQRGRLVELYGHTVVPATGADARYPWRIGSRLISMLRHLIDDRLSMQNADLPSTLVVLGEPSFYERGGFSLAQTQGLTSPYPLSHTLLLRGDDDVPEETLVYPAAFDAN